MGLLGLQTQIDDMEARHKADVEKLRARVKELEAQLLDEQDNYAGAMADLKYFEPLAARMRAERDDALDSLHALAEWVDELKRHFDAPGFAGVCMALEGGWDARGENA